MVEETTIYSIGVVEDLDGVNCILDGKVTMSSHLEFTVVLVVVPVMLMKE
jgi:hypothetical protein